MELKGKLKELHRQRAYKLFEYICNLPVDTPNRQEIINDWYKDTDKILEIHDQLVNICKES